MGKNHTGGQGSRRKAFAAVGGCALALGLAPVASADNTKGSLLSTYGGNARPLVSIAQPKAKNNGLPNTGLDVALVIAGGAGIGLLGFGLRRLARQKS